MVKREDITHLVNKIKTDRDELKVQMHLASMEAKQEFKDAEKKWEHFKEKASQVKDEAVETSEEYIAKAKIIGEELKETYSRIAKRLSK